MVQSYTVNPQSKVFGGRVVMRLVPASFCPPKNHGGLNSPTGRRVELYNLKYCTSLLLLNFIDKTIAMVHSMYYLAYLT